MRPALALPLLTGAALAAAVGCKAELARPQVVDATPAPVDAPADAPGIDAPVDARPCAGGDARVVAPDGSCLVRFDTPATYADAAAACTGIGARLAVIPAAPINAAITTLIGARDAFVGATDQAAEGTFVWATGAALTYTNWRSGEPNNAGGDFEEDCLIVEGALGGTWDDRPCAPPPLGAGAYAYVCQF